jgi:hypothetical protein
MNINPTDTSALAATPLTGNRMQRDQNGASSWFEAFAQAWGKALDNQAAVIEQRSDTLDNGGDNPSGITQLTAESLKMSFLSNSSHSSLDSVGKALETMARKG